MELNEYQKQALSTAVYPLDSEIIYPALGLCGEAGEVAEKIKKVLRDGGSFTNPKTVVAIAKELGDVLFYIAAIADNLGLTMDDVGNINLEKLRMRRKANTLKGNGDDR